MDRHEAFESAMMRVRMRYDAAGKPLPLFWELLKEATLELEEEDERLAVRQAVLDDKEKP